MELTEAQEIQIFDRPRIGMGDSPMTRQEWLRVLRHPKDLPDLQTPTMACIAPTVDPDRVYWMANYGQMSRIGFVGGSMVFDEWGPLKLVGGHLTYREAVK